VISGRLSASEDGTFLSEEPVTGSYTVAPDCTGTLTATPKGGSPLNFSFVIVDCGKEMLAVETDADTIVSGTLQREVFDSGGAQDDASKSDDAALRQQVMTDVHSPDEFVVAIVRNLDDWYAAFDVKPGDKLYLAPPDRVRIW
jgi:hypothetical protein